MGRPLSPRHVTPGRMPGTLIIKANRTGGRTFQPVAALACLMRELSAGNVLRGRRSRRHSILLLITMAALLGYCGRLVAGWAGIRWSILAASWNGTRGTQTGA